MKDVLAREGTATAAAWFLSVGELLDRIRLGAKPDYGQILRPSGEPDGPLKSGGIPSFLSRPAASFNPFSFCGLSCLRFNHQPQSRCWPQFLFLIKPTQAQARKGRICDALRKPSVPAAKLRKALPRTCFKGPSPRGGDDEMAGWTIEPLYDAHGEPHTDRESDPMDPAELARSAS
jgi:hypothetical protein